MADRRTTAAVFALLGHGVLAVRRLDLTATTGEASGKYAFEGGEPEATCKACKAVMEHVQRRVNMPMYGEFYGKERKGKMGIDSARNKSVNNAEKIDMSHP